MTRADALLRADECNRLANMVTNPHQQRVLRRMRDVWLGLAKHSDGLGDSIDDEFEQLLSIHSAIQSAFKQSVH